jgi:hypothetical protein
MKIQQNWKQQIKTQESSPVVYPNNKFSQYRKVVTSSNDGVNGLPTFSTIPSNFGSDEGKK